MEDMSFPRHLVPIAALVASSSFRSVDFSECSFLYAVRVAYACYILVVTRGDSGVGCYSRFNALFLGWDFVFPFQRSFFLRATSGFRRRTSGLSI